MINEFTKYDPNTGKITLIGSCNDAKLAAMTDYITGHWDAEIYHIVDGVAVEKPQAELDAQQLVKDTSDAINMRNALLAESDKYVLSDFPTTLGTEWQTYRQELRDLPDHVDWPNAALPIKPE